MSKTREEIARLPAGREMDVLVAEVMGWRVDYDSYNHWTALDASVDDLVLTAPGDVFHGERCISDVPHYSTDIAAAWQVVEKMRAEGQHIDFGSTVRGSLDDVRRGIQHGMWSVSIRGQRRPSARADTFPLAVCRVALSALGEIDV